MIPVFLRAAALAAPLLLAACGGASSENGPRAGTDNSHQAGAPTKPQDMSLGSPEAPVTVIEYASLTCPACAAFHEQVFPTIKEKYIDTGKVRLILREFPTPPAEFAYIGAVLARCASERGGSEAYVAVAGTLYRTQRSWIFGEDPKAELLKVAAQAGMDEAAFDACLKRQDLIDAINKGAEEASQKYNINATPTFLVNGEKANLRSFDDLQVRIEEALAKKAK